MRTSTWIISLWFILLSSLPACAAEGSVRAYVDRTTLAPGESLEFRVTVQGGEGEVDTSGLSDFKVFPRGTSTSVQIINNQTSREETHNFLLIPKRQGRLTIPALTVTVGGQVHQTKAITVNVSARSATGENAPPEVWVNVSLSDPEPYVGEQITYRFSLYQTVRVSSGTLEPPDFKSFSAKELKERESRRQIIDGREVVITDIHYVLVPLAPGRHTIEPATLQLGIVRADRRRQRRSPFDDFFDDPFFNRSRVEQKVLQSQPLVVQVRPLPPWPGPEPFSGLVGQFEMTSEIENTRLAVGDSTTLTVTVQGRGNIMDAQAPQPALPEGLKTYADAPEEQIRLGADGYEGKKVFRTALVPVQAGELQLPPVQLTYFDAEKERYLTLTASLPALSIQPATQEGPSIVASSQTPRTNKSLVSFTGRDILPAKEELTALETRRPLTWPLFLVWIISPAAAFGLLTLFQRLKQTDSSPSALMRARARQALKSAQADRTADPSSFLTALYKALTSAIYARLGRSGEALAWKEAEILLQENGVETEQARQAAELLTTIESSRFSGARLADAEREQLLERTRQMIRRLAP